MCHVLCCVASFAYPLSVEFEIKLRLVFSVSGFFASFSSCLSFFRFLSFSFSSSSMKS